MSDDEARAAVTRLVCAQLAAVLSMDAISARLARLIHERMAQPAVPPG
ncbi:hypothetical protein [Streptomyces triculaminicus]